MLSDRARELCEILQCPRTQQPLAWVSPHALGAGSGGPAYEVRDDIIRFLSDGATPGDIARDYYESEDCPEEAHRFDKTRRAYVDTREAPLRFTHRCMARLRKYFAGGGRYLLDAGSGPVEHDEVLGYGANYETRVCVDVSPRALRAASSRLGSRGVYLEGDLTCLPIKDDSMDAVTCNHVIYQVPPELQRQAILELHRVLKPGGVGVIVYWWPDAPLMRWMERIARRLGPARQTEGADAQAQPVRTPPHAPFPRAWFERQDWPFRYKFDAFRVVTNQFMKQHVDDGPGGRIFLDALFALQCVAPEFCGKYGAIPAIVMHKAPGGPG